MFSQLSPNRLRAASLVIVFCVVSMLIAPSGVLASAPHPQESGPAVDTPIVESAHPYANNFNNFWTIAMPGAQATRIHFSRIELENPADYLIISDPSEQRTQVITGSYPTGLWTDPVPGGYVRIRLITDVNVRKWGFAVDQKEEISYASTLRSPHPYHNDTNQAWTVLNTNPSPGPATRIHLSKIELEANVDWLILSDVSGNPYQYITGSHPGGLWSTGIPGIAVKVQLVTDGTVERWGFNVDDSQNTTANAPQAPPMFQVVTESPHPYTNGHDEWWTITNPDISAASTKVHFTRIELGPYDYLQIYDATDRLVQEWAAGGAVLNLSDVWSDYVPGPIVKIHLVEADVYGGHWGFRIDRIVNGENLTVWAQSHHPYLNGDDEWWTFVNPNASASATRVHFSRIQLGPYDLLQVLDATDRVIQQWAPGGNVFEQYDVWSDDVPGPIIKVHLQERDVYGGHWGFRIDDIYPLNADPIPVAAITGVYLTVARPGRIYLNNVQVAYAQEPGEYKVLLPGLGEHTIRIEYIGTTQEIRVTVRQDTGLSILYMPLVQTNR